MSFQPGDIVVHAALGRGEVLDVRTEDALVVLFEDDVRALVSRRALRLIARRTWNGSGPRRDVRAARRRGKRRMRA